MKRLEHRGGNIKKSNQGELFKITEVNFIPRVQYCLHVKPADVPIFIIVQPPRTTWGEYTFAEAHPDTIFFNGFVPWSLGKTMCDVGLQS